MRTLTGSELSGSHVGEAIYAEQPAVHCLPRVLPAGTWRFELWLFLSSFGVWFALLSWLQLFSPGPPVTFVCDGPNRGFFALLFGFCLYVCVARDHGRTPRFGVDAHVHVDLEHGHATGPAVIRPDGAVPLLAAAHLDHDGVS